MWMKLDTVFGAGAWHRFGVSWTESVATCPAKSAFVTALERQGFDVTIWPAGGDHIFIGEVRPKLTGMTGQDFYTAVLPFSPSGIAVEGESTPHSEISSAWGNRLQKLMKPDAGIDDLFDIGWTTWLPIVVGIVGVGVAIYFGTRRR